MTRLISTSQTMKRDRNESLGRLICLTAQDIKSSAEKLLRPHELTFEQFLLLKHLSPDTGITQRELGNLVIKTPGNTTRILDRLESKRLVVRRSSKKDRRTSLVFLTNRGHKLALEVSAIFESFENQLARGIGTREQESARETLNKIAMNNRTMSSGLDK